MAIEEKQERKLSAREMQIKRLMEEREDRFWAAQAVRVDNNTGHDDQ